MGGRSLPVLGVKMGGHSLYFADLFDSALLGWSGAGSVAGGALTITPSETPVSLTDPGMEAWTSATNLTNWTETVAGTSTINQEASVVHDGSNAARMDIDASNSLAQIIQNVTVQTGSWYRAAIWSRADSGTPGAAVYLSNSSMNNAVSIALSTSFQSIFHTGWCTNAVGAAFALKRATGAASRLIYFDDATLNLLTTLFHGRLHTVPHGVYTFNWTRTAFTQAGMFVNGNHPSSPTIYRHIYDGGDGKMYIDNVNGATRTAVGNYAFTYAGDNAGIITVHRNLTVDLQVGAAVLVSGAAAMGGEGNYWGLFSTYASNSFSQVSVDSRSVS